MREPAAAAAGWFAPGPLLSPRPEGGSAARTAGWPVFTLTGQ